MVHSVVRGSVEYPLKRTTRPHYLRVNPKLVNQVDLTAKGGVFRERKKDTTQYLIMHQVQLCRKEQSQWKIANPREYYSTGTPSQCSAEVVLFRRMMGSMSTPPTVYFMRESMVPYCSQRRVVFQPKSELK